jgi:hypothetical protein
MRTALSTDVNFVHQPSGKFPLKTSPTSATPSHVTEPLSSPAKLAKALSQFYYLDSPPKSHNFDLGLGCRSPDMDRQPHPPNYMAAAGPQPAQVFREHNDPPQFVCTEETCGKRFGRKEHLARHMRARSPPMTCSILS